MDVYKTLTIKSTSGNPADTIILVANPNEYGFEVNADYVYLSGFTVEGASGGISLNHAYYCNISNNICSNNWNGGILLDHSNSNIILNNICSNNGHGINLWHSNGNSILNNIYNKQRGEGIHLCTSNGNSISNNNCSNNEYGIWLYGSGTNNAIYLNNFMNNIDNVYSDYGLTNIWNSTEKISYIYNGSTYTNYLGNYWDDYEGSDADGDGIGKTAYNVGGDDSDNYPLMERWENYFKPTPPLNEQPQLKAPWKGTKKITQGNYGTVSHYDHGTWDNTYAIDAALNYEYVLAPADGVVIYVDGDPKGAGGKELAINHTGPTGKNFTTVYLHLSKILVKKGSYVKQGQAVAKSGATGTVTGPHLHFHIWNSSRGRSYDSHTIPIERLVLKQVGVESEFREYDARKGDLNDSKVAWKFFESDNIPIPSVTISTNKYGYTAGETMLTNITIANPTEDRQQVVFAWRLDLPDYGWQQWVAVLELDLAPGYEETFSIPFTLGEYGFGFNASWFVALYNATTFEVISDDTADWRFVSESGKTAEREGMPEEIAKEMSKTVKESKFDILNEW